MAHRDRIAKGRRLAETVGSPPLMFEEGNVTVRISALGFLHYANVTVGNPPEWFLVALDTGSDLFWLPCDCTRCFHGSLLTRSGKQIDLNIYSPSNSSTSETSACNSTFCGQRNRQCSANNVCAYQVRYLSVNTSSSGILVQDVLHLATDDSQQKSVDATVTLGCGMVQTGAFLETAAPNGLFGLGMDNISVPSILASQGLAANTFSMCFGPDGIGRIVFGDKGSSDQSETPFNLGQSRPTYNISVTQIIVGDNVADVGFTAIFDSGTSFTFLNDPAYSIITQNFNSQAKEPRHQPDPKLPFEYCYNLSTTQTTIGAPDLNLTMEGGKNFFLKQPIVIMSDGNGGFVYCLGVVKSGDINIIGQNFMTGYRVIFDREKMVLGWKESDCYDSNGSNKNSTTLPVNQQNSTEAPSPSSVQPEATSGNENGSPVPTPTLPTGRAGNNAPHVNSFSSKLLMILFAFFSHYLVIFYS